MKGRANRTKGRVCLAVIITKGEDYDKYERVTLWLKTTTKQKQNQERQRGRGKTDQSTHQLAS